MGTRNAENIHTRGGHGRRIAVTSSSRTSADWRGRPVDRLQRCGRRPDEDWRNAGCRGPEQSRRCTRQTGPVNGFRRCMRPEAGSLRRQPDGGKEGRAGGGTLLLRQLDPGEQSVFGRRHSGDFACLDQSEIYRRGWLGHVPRLRPRRPAGRGCRPVSGETFQGPEDRDPERQLGLRKRPRR